LNRNRKLRLIHTSDVHLEIDLFGSSESGATQRWRVRQAFSSVIDLANSRKADLMLIVGDLFDSSRIEPGALNFALGEIERARMPVVIVPGNHDAHDERSIYAALSTEVLPSNLHLILEPSGRSIDFDALGVRVWGRALVEHSPEYRPLFGIPAPTDDRWNIALAHGLFTGTDPSERSSQITSAEIESSGYDYIALGHVHIFGDASCGGTAAFYCGTPAPLYGGSKEGTAACVELVPGRPAVVEPVNILV
jgi:DNA repair exonuclease SbcCD nuclease subunit